MKNRTKKARKAAIYIMILFMVLSLASCTKGNDSDIIIEKWDNTNFRDFASSVGLNVFNENSYTDNFKENDTLFITDFNNPITAKFNSNGKDRDFVMSVYYDYEQIDFRIGENGIFSDNYIFSLADGYEIELPLYLPNTLTMDGIHKLFITFCIGSEVHAKDLETVSNWYGTSKVYDVIYSKTDIGITDNNLYEAPTQVIDLTYDFSFNQDFDYSMMDTEIMPFPPKILTVKPNEEFKLMYNVSPFDNENGKILILATIGFKQTKINGQQYFLVNVPTGTTGIGELAFTAPSETGYYEVIAYAVKNPFVKVQNPDIFTDVESSFRFTLQVSE